MNSTPTRATSRHPLHTSFQTTPLRLLNGLSPLQFMKRHWQKKPLLVRAAIPGFNPLLSRSELVALAGRQEVESRLIVQTPNVNPRKSPKGRANSAASASWQLQHGPFDKRELPPFKQAAWTLLVQGVDLHDDRVHDLLQQFRFVPDARLDDLMISYATPGGGVGPHFDSYDVFLLQATGQRRWRIGRQKDLRLQEDVPLKILQNFDYEEEFVLEAGDMLYLPPRYAHDGVAVGAGDCMTYSVGFRSPAQNELANELLQRLAEDVMDASPSEANPTRPIQFYKDPHQIAVSPRDDAVDIPEALQQFALQAVQNALKDPFALERVLGAYLTEPKAQVWFEPLEKIPTALRSVRLARTTRILVDAHHVHVNGESWRAAGQDAKLLRKLAQQRFLDDRDMKNISPQARTLLRQWCEDGWALPKNAKNNLK